MKRKLSFVLTLLIFGCILFSCNDTKENGIVVVVFEGNKFTVKHNGMLSRYYFSFSKRKDGFYDMYQGMIEYLVYFRKTKNMYTVNKASCTNSIETLNELGNILKVAKETYPIDSIRQIYTDTDIFLDIANELAVKLNTKERLKGEKVENVIKQTSLISNINEVVSNYGLEVTCITLGPEAKPIKSNTERYNQGAFYTGKKGERPKELLFIPLSIILDKKTPN